MAEKGSKGLGAMPPELTGKNIGKVEKDTMQKVNKALSVLESALAAWDAEKEKPKRLEAKFARFRRFHDALAAWESKALKAAGRKESFDERVRRLREFTEICFTYGRG